MNDRLALLTTADDPRLGTVIGARVDGTILTRDSGPGIALFGGYYSLPAGHYRVFVWLSKTVTCYGSGKLEIYSQARHWILTQKPFDVVELSSEAPFVEIYFSLFQEIDDLEVRLHANPGLTLAIKAIELIKLDASGQTVEAERHVLRPGDARRPLKILYYSCHEILEFDELRMLTDRGHHVFSLGAFADPRSQGHLRTPLPSFFSPGDWERYSSEGLTPAFAREFDLAIVMHQVSNVREILGIRPDMPVIYRSIGQSNRAVEQELWPFHDKVKVVRYSERERDLPGFLPAEDVIYFGKNLDDFAVPWKGGSRLLTFHNGYPLRNYASVPPKEMYLQLAASWPCDLYGSGNEEVPGSNGIASPESQLELYRAAAIYLYVYTVGPSYTLSFMEAMGVGLPIVAPSAAMIERVLGPSMVEEASFSDGAGRYEIEDFLDHDPRLIYSSLEEAQEKIEWLLKNPNYCVEVSHRLRARFRAVFDDKKIADQWDRLMYRMVS